MTTIYAVCVKCAHVEPRPSHADDADTLLKRIRDIATSLPDPCEGSRGHLAIEDWRGFECDLDLLRTDPSNEILRWADGSFLTMPELVKLMVLWLEHAKGAGI